MLPLGPASLFTLDILPPKASVLAQMGFDSNGHMTVRFRAIKNRRILPDRVFPWTGWFHYEGEAIELRWQDLTHLPNYEYNELIPASDEVDEWIDRKMEEES